MTNMRRGFTMIELIFVIVIIGILASVALPKLAGTAAEAHNGVLKSFEGTMNRTVGATMYAKSIGAGDGGSVLTAGKYLNNLSAYTDIPDELGGNSIVVSATGDITVPASGGATGTFTMVHDGNTTEAPQWEYDPAG